VALRRESHGSFLLLILLLLLLLLLVVVVLVLMLGLSHSLVWVVLLLRQK
jgi:hypothetical protein